MSTYNPYTVYSPYTVYNPYGLNSSTFEIKYHNDTYKFYNDGNSGYTARYVAFKAPEYYINNYKVSEDEYYSKFKYFKSFNNGLKQNVEVMPADIPSNPNTEKVKIDSYKETPCDDCGKFCNQQCSYVSETNFGVIDMGNVGIIDMRGKKDVIGIPYGTTIIGMDGTTPGTYLTSNGL